MILPTAKTPPKTDISDLSMLIYGPSKIGKSTVCAQFEDTVFFATEPGLNALDVYQVPISDWETMLATCREIAEGKHPFKTVVLDTVDLAYRFCSDYICKKANILHESDLGYGKGFSLVNAEFHRVINRLAQLPYGLILVSHSMEKEIETRTGKRTRITPTLPDKASKIVLGLVDMILFCDLEVTQNEDEKAVTRRVMRTKPSPHFSAGDRTGRLPEVIELDYNAFLQAFNSGQSGESNPVVLTTNTTADDC